MITNRHSRVPRWIAGFLCPDAVRQPDRSRHGVPAISADELNADELEADELETESWRVGLCDAGRVRQVYAHDAVVWMGPTDDPDAIGAAVTVALCGHWQHDPPCPLAPHATRADRSGGQVRVRTLFATEPDLELEVRRRIDDALAVGTQQAPTGETSSWEYLSSDPGIVQESERDHGERLIDS